MSIHKNRMLTLLMDLRPVHDHKMLSVDQTDVSNMIVAISWSFNLHGK